ncbi:hypothetical protein PVAND_004050 [Polypedilum vanderplanki]|uniref:Glucose-methanol-choline oxidoreductase N-terminal domain-containing protein n=1 Tax=Polypedilum vanderplanki TaxID=319348 RepID=A0A9J6BXX4_POLVA|nr:hypothetical protein PVAND_004050 [Polypedilum vanderplanki]
MLENLLIHLMHLFEVLLCGGYNQLDDINCGPPYNGFANVRMTVLGGQRNSAARAFLLPIAGIGNCSNFNIMASREVILSAGGYGSPQILQRSGFGKAADLNACNITQLNDLPVGLNLSDHVVAV